MQGNFVEMARSQPVRLQTLRLWRGEPGADKTRWVRNPRYALGVIRPR